MFVSNYSLEFSCHNVHMFDALFLQETFKYSSPRY